MKNDTIKSAAAALGSIKSAAKAEAARENGKLGGRPKFQPYLVDYGTTAGIHYGDGTRFTAGQATSPRPEYENRMKDFGFRCVPLVDASEEDLRLLDNWDLDRVREGIARLKDGERWD